MSLSLLHLKRFWTARKPKIVLLLPLQHTRFWTCLPPPCPSCRAGRKQVANMPRAIPTSSSLPAEASAAGSRAVHCLRRSREMTRPTAIGKLGNGSKSSNWRTSSIRSWSAATSVAWRVMCCCRAGTLLLAWTGMPTAKMFGWRSPMRTNTDSIANFSHNLVLREFATIYFLFCAGYSLVIT